MLDARVKPAHDDFPRDYVMISSYKSRHAGFMVRGLDPRIHRERPSSAKHDGLPD
jgi:hypothetical protein